MKYTGCLLALLSAQEAFIARPCVAIDIAPSDNHVKELDSITVFASKPNLSSASQGTISAQSINSMPLLRPAEVLEQIPGMVVTQHSGDGKANQYFLRGYNLDHGTDFATSIEGMPVNMPSHAHGQGYTDLNFMIPELVKRIDYRKGPYYADSGDFSTAGTAKILYYDKLPEGNQSSLTLGSFGYRRLLLLADSTNIVKDSFSNASPVILGGLEIMQNQGPWTIPENLNKLNGVLHLSQQTENKYWKMTIGGYKAHWAATDQMPLAAIESGKMNRFDAVDDTDGGNTEKLFITGQGLFQHKNGFSNASAYFQANRLNLWSNFSYFLDHIDQGDQFLQSENRHVTGGQLSRTWNYPIFNRQNTFEAGLRGRYDDINLGLFNTYQRTVSSPIAQDLVRIGEGSLYLTQQTVWLPWLTSNIGLQAQNVWMFLHPLMDLQSFKKRDHLIAPKLGLTFTPFSNLQLFYNYGKGFHSNDVRGVFYRVDANGNTIEPAPPLVSAKGEELGVKTSFKNIETSFAIWKLNNNSELVYVADAGGTEAKGASKRYGIEWQLNWKITPLVNFQTNYAWVKARYRQWDDNDPGLYIPNAVNQTGSIRINTKYKKLASQFEMRYIGSYPLSRDNSLHTPASSIANIGLSYPIHQKVDLRFEILNVFNKAYYDIAYGQAFRLTPTDEAVLNGMTVHPGEPRQFRISSSFKF